MAEIKTQRNKRSVDAFLKSIPDEQKRNDASTIVDIMRKATKSEPAMWGTAIVALARITISMPAGREGDWFLTRLLAAQANLTLYIMGASSGTPNC